MSRLWTEEDDEYLACNFLCATCKEMADHLGKTENTVATRMSKIGLRRSGKKMTRHKFYI